MTSTLCRSLGPALLALAVALPAQAQTAPPGVTAPQNRMCVQLEGQLAALDRGGSDPARAEQIRKLEDAANKQQFDLDRANSQSRQAGCERSGFFILFSGQSEQCAPLNTKVQQARAALERTRSELASLQGGTGPEREAQRRGILAALGQNDCGPQYRQAAATPPRSGNLFESLFGPNSIFTPDTSSQSGTYKTVCVRTCDGYYYPISFATSPARFADDARTCQRSCPAAEVALYSHRNPGEDINQATSTTTGQPYTALPNAFRHRQTFDQSCSCRRPGETWSQALKHLDEQVERGDIVVNEERARQLSQPRVDAQGRPIRPEPRSTRPDPRGVAKPATPVAAAAPAAEGSAEPDPNRPVRSVGPTFLPAR
jgi:hypothetical protein